MEFINEDTSGGVSLCGGARDEMMCQEGRDAVESLSDSVDVQVWLRRCGVKMN